LSACGSARPGGRPTGWTTNLRMSVSSRHRANRHHWCIGMGHGGASSSVDASQGIRSRDKGLSALHRPHRRREHSRPGSPPRAHGVGGRVSAPVSRARAAVWGAGGDHARTPAPPAGDGGTRAPARRDGPHAPAPAARVRWPRGRRPSWCPWGKPWPSCRSVDTFPPRWPSSRRLRPCRRRPRRAPCSLPRHSSWSVAGCSLSDSGHIGYTFLNISDVCGDSYTPVQPASGFALRRLAHGPRVRACAPRVRMARCAAEVGGSPGGSAHSRWPCRVYCP
jgi:hypothetical protein